MDEQQINDQLLNQGKAFPWHEVYTPDVEKTIEFYKETLGWTHTSMDMGGDFTYNMFEKDGRAICGILPNDMGHGKIPAHWAVYTSVDNVDERLAKAIELGATVMVGPMDVPTVGRMVLIKDPQDATIWLFESRP